MYIVSVKYNPLFSETVFESNNLKDIIHIVWDLFFIDNFSINEIIVDSIMGYLNVEELLKLNPNYKR